METAVGTWTRDLLMKINSMTKYPSIPTYHEIGDRGVLNEKLNVEFTRHDTDVFIYEKIDGANSRIIILPNSLHSGEDVCIGSREDLLHFQGDILWTPDCRIVETVRPIVVEKDIEHAYDDNSVRVLYVETYGEKANRKPARNYSSKGEHGIRLFDIAVFDYKVWSDLMNKEIEEIALWRKNNQSNHFLNEEHMRKEAARLGLPVVPFVARSRYFELPRTVEEAHVYLIDICPETFIAHDDEADKRSEGVVLRTFNRSKIAKMRHQSYNRTMQFREQG